MRKILRPAPAIIRALACTGALAVSALGVGAAHAQTTNSNSYYNPYHSNNSTYSYGLNLPQVPQPSSSDEVRAADGTTCKSSIASNGAYLDVGGIGSQSEEGLFNQGSVYGRVIIPLGEQPKRVDCTGLYQLEIQRLQGELQLVRMGLNGASAPGPVTSSLTGDKKNAWANEGWSNSGWAPVAKADNTTSASPPAAKAIAKPKAVAQRKDQPAKRSQAPQQIETGSVLSSDLDNAEMLVKID